MKKRAIEKARAKECTKKRAYITREAALEILTALPGQHAYKCRFCAYWHTGHAKLR